jgi:hypothetical protein
MTISATTPGDLPTQALPAPLSPEPGAGSEEADLAALAAALTAFGCQAGLMMPRPCLAIRPPGALAPGLVCAARPHFYLPSTEPAGSRAEIGLLAGNRLCEYEKGPDSQRKPSIYVLVMLAIVYRTGVLNLLDLTDAKWCAVVSYGGRRNRLCVSERCSWTHLSKSHWPHPASSNFFWPHRLGPEPLATCLAEPFSSVSRAQPGGAGTTCQTIFVGPREVREVGPEPVREIRLCQCGRNY